jgi:hypothetical protein
MKAHLFRKFVIEPFATEEEGKFFEEPRHKLHDDLLQARTLNTKGTKKNGKATKDNWFVIPHASP